MSYVLGSRVIHVHFPHREGLLVLRLADNMTTQHLIRLIKKEHKCLRKEVLYLFDKDDRLLPRTISLGDYIHAHSLEEPLKLSVRTESCFGTLSAQFISAHVVKLGSVYKASIMYSYYGLYNFEKSDIFSGLEEARMWIIRERCHNRYFEQN